MTGYVLEATYEQASKIGLFRSQEWQAYSKDFFYDVPLIGNEEIAEFCQEYCNKKIECFFSVDLDTFSVIPFYYNPDYDPQYTDLFEGWWFQLDEDDLYTKEWTEIGTIFAAQGNFPKQQNWVSKRRKDYD